jgi:hypothetical protein
MKYNQASRSMFMIRPASFGFNDQTAETNGFQINDADKQNEINQLAVAEFDHMFDLLTAHGIDVRVFDDTISPAKPDAVYPNNWISLHADGTVVLYPMMTGNRRTEIRQDIIHQIEAEFIISKTVDLSLESQNGNFLEGTGSLVFDHVNRLAYTCRSPRTNEELVYKLCNMLSYKPVIFDAFDEQKKPIYHTNVLMCIGKRFAVICLDAIPSEKDQDLILDNFAVTGHRIIAISYAQMRAFAGNMLEVETADSDPVVVLSESAFDCFLPGQINAISQFAELLPIKISTIERFGGGSVRCMITEIHLPKRNPI